MTGTPSGPRSGAGASDPHRRPGAGPVDPPPDLDDDTHIIGMAPVRGGSPPTAPGPTEPEPAGFDPAGLDPTEPEPSTRDQVDLPPRIDPSELAGLHTEGGGTSLGVRRVLPLEDEPSRIVARYLFPTEHYRGEWKRHIVHLLWPMTIGVLSTFVLGWLSGFLTRFGSWGWITYTMVLIWLGFMGYVAWRVADWHLARFILTNKRVMKVSGIITRKVAMMPLLRVTDMKYEQTPLGRILNYGTFVIESAGQDQALREVPHLPNPNELYLRVVEEMYEPAAVEARLGGDSEESEEGQRVGDI
jgi:membrane protein YdbS with pleckstrin-like domain